MLLLLVSSQIVAAQPEQSAPLFTADDFPSYLTQSTGVLARVTADTTGKPINCQVEIPSADPRVNTLTCNILMERSEFTPAHWIDGSPVMAVVRTPVMWSWTSDLSLRPDIDLSVSNLPAGRRSPVMVRLVIAVEANGAIAGCAGERFPGSADKQQPTPELIALACNEASQGWEPIPARDSAGVAQRSIQNATVRFTTKKIRG